MAHTLTDTPSENTVAETLHQLCSLGGRGAWVMTTEVAEAVLEARPELTRPEVAAAVKTLVADGDIELNYMPASCGATCLRVVA